MNPCEVVPPLGGGVGPLGGGVGPLDGGVGPPLGPHCNKLSKCSGLFVTHLGQPCKSRGYVKRCHKILYTKLFGGQWPVLTNNYEFGTS